MSLFLLLQDVVAQVPPQTIMVTENAGRRDILLAIIAGTVTITVTLGPLFINRWMDKLKEEREEAAKMVAAAAADVAERVEEVKAVASATTTGIAALQVTADKTHILVNSNFSEIRNELKLSNENNQRMTKLLMRAGILPPEQPPPSGIIAEAGGERRVGEPDRRDEPEPEPEKP